MSASTTSKSVEGKWAEFKHAFSSSQAFLNWIQVELTVDSDGNVNPWVNEGKSTPILSLHVIFTHSRIDLKPTPVEKQSKLLSLIHL